MKRVFDCLLRKADQSPPKTLRFAAVQGGLLRYFALRAPAHKSPMGGCVISYFCVCGVCVPFVPAYATGGGNWSLFDECNFRSQASLLRSPFLGFNLCACGVSASAHRQSPCVGSTYAQRDSNVGRQIFQRWNSHLSSPRLSAINSAQYLRRDRHRRINCGQMAARYFFAISCAYRRFGGLLRSGISGRSLSGRQALAVGAGEP